MALWEQSEDVDGNGSPVRCHCRIELSEFAAGSRGHLKMESSEATESISLPGAESLGTLAAPIGLELVVNYK